MVAVGRRRLPPVEETSSLAQVFANRAFVNAGRFVVLLYILSWVAPNFILSNCRILYLGFGTIWCFFAVSRLREFPRLCWPVCMTLVIQMWSIFTALYGSLVLGRQLNAGRPDYYLMEALIPFFVSSVLTRFDPDAWKFLFKSLSIAFGASCVVGYLQFLRIPPTIAMSHWYTEKSIDFWDNVPGIRAIGLSWHPNGLAFQALILLGIVGGKCLYEKPTLKDLGLLMAISGTVIITQARISYFVLLVVWVLLGMSLYRQDRVLFGKFAAICGCCLAVVLVGVGKRLSYTMQSNSAQKDVSYQHRANVVWAQLDPIYPRFALTGIGPTSGLMLGTGPEDKYVQRGIILESAYRLYLAMYGIPGLVLFIITLASAILGSIRAALNKSLNEGARRTACVCCVASIYLTINGFTLNTVDNYTLLSLSFLMAGTTVASVYGSNPSRVMRLPRRVASQ